MMIFLRQLFIITLLVGMLPMMGRGSAAVAVDFKSTIQPLLKNYCFDCHGEKKTKAGVDLKEFIDEAAVKRDLPTWRKVDEQLANKEMPPEESKNSLTDADRAMLREWLNATIKDALADAVKVKDPGIMPIRRLTRIQYRNSVRDLLGIPIDAAELVSLPSDNERGYDTYAGTLNIPPLLFEKYHAAAKQALTALTPDSAGWKMVVIADPGKTATTQKTAARTIITRFARRAYRRPVAPEESARLYKLFDTLAASRPFEDSIRTTLCAVLVSPNFLFRIEQDRGGARSKEAYPISSFDLATRLSYLLWSTTPDDELSMLADKGTLTQPAILEAQVVRLLADDRARALSEGFFATWLQIDHLDRARPMQSNFPSFTETLRKAMYDETLTFVNELRKNNGSLLDLLKSDHLYVNEELASHYGIAGVTGAELRKVAIPTGMNRGGVLGMGSVLTMTSHTYRTSPTLRGKWVLEVLLGTPPPPPPADVEPISEDTTPGTAAKSFRDQLEKHVTDAACASCHRKMDPLGFSLDNYDAIGAWRESTAARPLDTNGTLPTGEKMTGANDLRTILWKNRSQVMRTLVSQFLLYATGRDLITADEVVVQDVLARLDADGHRFSSLIMGIVTSTPFLMRAPGK